MLDGKHHPEVALHTDRSETENAVVEGHEEDKARQWAEDVRQVPDHVIVRFLHLKGQEDENVSRCGLLSHFLADSLERQNIRQEGHDKGDDVDWQRQSFLALMHNGGLRQSQLEMHHMNSDHWENKPEEGLVGYSLQRKFGLPVLSEKAPIIFVSVRFLSAVDEI